MTRIVLHIGPGKCGSSTIQQAILQKGTDVTGGITGAILPPRHLSKLNSPTPLPETVSYFHNFIEAAQRSNPENILVLSHEALFKFVDAMANLAGIAREHADEVVVIGYVRRQSDFLVSSYRQWLFRAPERISETASVLQANGFDPTLFWGVERHLIAAILGNWRVGRQLSGHLYFDWSISLPQRAHALQSYHIPLSMGLLPRARFNSNLVLDFLNRAGVKSDALAIVLESKNKSFHPSLIESVLNAIEAGYEMPGPHESNVFFQRFSEFTNGIQPPKPQFLSRLKTHIDTAFEARNTKVSREFGFDPEYFIPSAQIDALTIVEEIKVEAAERASTPRELRQREILRRATFAKKSWAAFQQSD